jgi:cytochrome c-type biogenesis protein CcmF
MGNLGFMTLMLAGVLAFYSMITSIIGAKINSEGLTRSATNASYLTSFILSISTLCLIYAFTTHDFSLNYVASHSSLNLDPKLTWVALYAGNEGSLLFIAWIFSVLATIAIWKCPTLAKPGLPYTTATLMFILLFYIVVMSTMANPFEKLDIPPIDGRGMNPLLTHPGMFLHPPMLMTGLIGVGIPFSFGIGQLISGEQGNEWLIAARYWGLIIWCILTIGLMLGSWWAYTILGWGGYWGWDPVENAGLLPWLPLTAFVHSIIVQQRRNMFKSWNIALIIFAWGFAMYGMFMNRGGPVPSVHSFGQSTMGWIFLLFLGFNLIVALILFYINHKKLKDNSQIDSFLSREASFLVNNLLFLLIAFVTLWGVLYPLISDIFKGVVVTVGQPYYNTLTGPIFLCLVVLMGIGPLMPWRSLNNKRIMKRFITPIIISTVTLIICIILGIHKIAPLISFSTCTFVLTGILREWITGTRIRSKRNNEILPIAFIKLLLSNKPRYGGYIAHFGVVILAFSVTGSSFFSLQQDFSLSLGQEAELGSYKIQYIAIENITNVDNVETKAIVNLYKNGSFLGILKPGYVFYPSFNMASVRAGIISSPVEDFYLIASEFRENQAMFRIHINPLVFWMWISGPIFILGTILALLPGKPKYSTEIEQLEKR